MAPQKAVTANAIMGVSCLVSTLFFLLFLSQHLQAPVALSVFTLASGTVIWVAVLFAQTKKQLKNVIQHGTNGAIKNFRLSRALMLTFALLAVGIAVILLAFYIAYYQPFWIFLVNFLVPFPPAMYLMPTIYFWRWQRKSKQTLYIVGGKLSLIPT